MYKCPILSDNSGTFQLYGFIVQPSLSYPVNDTNNDTTHVLCTVYSGSRYPVYLKRGNITYFVGRHFCRNSDD